MYMYKYTACGKFIVKKELFTDTSSFNSSMGTSNSFNVGASTIASATTTIQKTTDSIGIPSVLSDASMNLPTTDIVSIPYTGVVSTPTTDIVSTPTANVVSTPTANVVSTPTANVVSTPTANVVSTPTANLLFSNQSTHSKESNFIKF